jgi:hypothetical protein
MALAESHEPHQSAETVVSKPLAYSGIKVLH